MGEDSHISLDPHANDSLCGKILLSSGIEGDVVRESVEEKNLRVGLKDCTAISDLSPMGEIRRTEFTDGTSNLAPIPFVRDYKACEKVMKRPQLRHQFAQHQSRRQGAGDAPGNWSISHECNAPTYTSHRGVFYIRAGLISVTLAK